MAAGNPPRPGRMLALVALVVVGLYAAVAFGPTHTPKLGLDLRGGTQVILTAKPFAGGDVTSSALDQAADIVRQRVNGLGVSEAEVTTQGNDHIIVSVPGRGREEVAGLVGQTALLRFRPVLQEAPGAPAPAAPATTAPPASSKAAPARPTPTSSPSAQRRPLSGALVQPAATPAPTSPTPSATPAPAPTGGGAADVVPGAASTSLPRAQAVFEKVDCTKNRNPTQGDDRPEHHVISCNEDGTAKYLLGPAEVQGVDVTTASADLADTQGWIVSLSFNGKGRDAWAKMTTRVNRLPDVPNCGPPTGCNAVAIVLDGMVMSAPRIQEPILGGNAQISGNFTQRTASELANVLKYGALPLRFEKSSIDAVSPTLGSDQLRGGMIAGAIGIGLVIVYLLLYYRGLGLVAVASLLLSGVLLYALTTVLGHRIGYTLTLAGIAGFIVAVGITADSFVVFFERLRDEVREGRRLRSAVERAWPRARRTILSADTVSVLAAAVLYLLSVGGVRGFAFTLGLSTLVDLFIVFLFTKPVLTLLSRTSRFDRGAAWTGVGRSRMTGEEQPSAGPRRQPSPTGARR